jgi:hypothetical protein
VYVLAGCPGGDTLTVATKNAPFLIVLVLGWQALGEMLQTLKT